MAATRRPPYLPASRDEDEYEEEDERVVPVVRPEPATNLQGRPVWERLGEDEPEEAATITIPTTVRIGVISEDPRKVSLICECGNVASYSLKAVHRVLGACENSGCLKKALEKIEGWAYLAQNKTWGIVQEDSALETPKPRLSIQEEIRIFQRAQRLDPSGTVDEATEAALRKEGREGMIPVWKSRLLEEVDPTTDDASV